jgi:hypothetical protein
MDKKIYLRLQHKWQNDIVVIKEQLFFVLFQLMLIWQHQMDLNFRSNGIQQVKELSVLLQKLILWTKEQMLNQCF